MIVNQSVVLNTFLSFVYFIFLKILILIFMQIHYELYAPRVHLRKSAECPTLRSTGWSWSIQIFAPLGRGRGGGVFSKLSPPLGVRGDHRSTGERVEEWQNFRPYWEVTKYSPLLEGYQIFAPTGRWPNFRPYWGWPNFRPYWGWPKFRPYLG